MKVLNLDKKNFMERNLEEAYAAYEAEIGVKLTPGQKELIKEDMIYEEQVDLDEERIRANAELFRKNVEEKQKTNG